MKKVILPCVCLFYSLLAAACSSGPNLYEGKERAFDETAADRALTGHPKKSVYEILSFDLLKFRLEPVDLPERNPRL